MNRTTSEQRGGNRVAGAESGRRLLSVLLAFSESRPLWTAAELSTELGLTQSAVYRYVALLREVGLVEQVQGNRYRLSEQTAAMAAAAAAARAPLGEVAMPVLLRLRDTIDETVLVSRRSGWHVYRVASADSRKPVRLQFEAGQPMHLHEGSMARILLSAMPVAEQERYLATLDETQRSAPVLSAAERQKVHREGVAESFEEIDESIWGVGAAITVRGEVVGALGCAAPLFRTDIDKRRMIRELIVAGAAEVAALLD